MLQRVHICIADFYPLYNGFQQKLAACFKEPPLLTHTASLSETLHLCSNQPPPDLFMLATTILPDRILPTLLDLKQTYPPAKIILLFNAQDIQWQQDSWTTIVNGGVLKSDGASVWITAVLSVIDGFNYYSPAIHDRLFNNEQVGSHQQKWPPTEVALSNRDWRILILLARSQDNRQIARELGLSYKTIRNRLTIIYKTIGVQSRTEAMAWAIQHGLSIDE